MNKKIWTITIAIVLLAVFSNQTVSIKMSDYTKQLPETTNDIRYVDDNNTNGPWEGTIQHPYQNITDALENAYDGLTIFVFNGIYKENIIVNNTVNIIGENKSQTIIDGEYKPIIIKLTKEHIHVSNFTIKNSGGENEDVGIKILSNNNTISSCIVYRTRIGILFYQAQNNTINNCLLHTNGEATYFDNSINNEIKNCEICFNAIGINIQHSQYVQIENNYLHENGMGLFINDSSNITIANTAICDNNDNQGGFYIYYSQKINVTNCNICHNGVGFRIIGSSDIKIYKSDIHNISHFGVKLEKNSHDIIVSESELTYNFRYASHATDSKLKITNCNIFENKLEGVFLRRADCNARYNYWGKTTGPYFTGMRFFHRIHPDCGDFKYIPWYLKRLENIGADWEVTNVFTKTMIKGYHDDPMEIPGLDTDNDGCPDWWEEKYGYNASKWDDHGNLDEDEDALNNWEECYMDEYNTSPFYKDLFLELDWVKPEDPTVSNTPPVNIINDMKDVFQEHDIKLHVDIGDLGGGEEIKNYSNKFIDDVLVDIWWDYFLHNDLNNPRKNIFHYGIISDYGPNIGFAIVGWAHVNAFCIPAQFLAEHWPRWTRGRLITTGSMHELGHTLGLVADDFEGNDNQAASKIYFPEFWIYRNYKSCMNYRYTWKILDYSDGTNGRIDYDDWGNLDFAFFKQTHWEWPKT